MVRNFFRSKFQLSCARRYCFSSMAQQNGQPIEKNQTPPRRTLTASIWSSPDFLASSCAAPSAAKREKLKAVCNEDTVGSIPFSDRMGAASTILPMRVNLAPGESCSSGTSTFGSILEFIAINSADIADSNGSDFCRARKPSKRVANSLSKSVRSIFISFLFHSSNRDPAASAYAVCRSVSSTRDCAIVPEVIANDAAAVRAASNFGIMGSPPTDSFTDRYLQLRIR